MDDQAIQSAWCLQQTGDQVVRSTWCHQQTGDQVVRMGWCFQRTGDKAVRTGWFFQQMGDQAFVAFWKHGWQTACKQKAIWKWKAVRYVFPWEVTNVSKGTQLVCKGKNYNWLVYHITNCLCCMPKKLNHQQFFIQLTLVVRVEVFPMQLYVYCDQHSKFCCEGLHVAPT